MLFRSNDTATTEIYTSIDTLSLHDALPISAAIDAVKALRTPTKPGDAFSTAIYSDGNPYGVPAGLIFGFPCRSQGDSNCEIVPGFASDDFLKAKLKKSIDELTEERAIIQNLLS